MTEKNEYQKGSHFGKEILKLVLLMIVLVALMFALKAFF